MLVRPVFHCLLQDEHALHHAILMDNVHWASLLPESRVALTRLHKKHKLQQALHGHLWLTGGCDGLCKAVAASYAIRLNADNIQDPKVLAIPQLGPCTQGAHSCQMAHASKT